MRSAPAILSLLLGAASCAGGGSSAGSRCDDACARDEKCNFDQGSPYCDDECEDDISALRSEFADAYFTCYADLRCDVGRTECEVEASGAVDRRTLDDEFQTACQTKATECEDVFSSDLCFVSHYYSNGAVDAADECLALACGDVGSCLLREFPFTPFDR